MKLIDKETLVMLLRLKGYGKRTMDLIDSVHEVDVIPVGWIKDRLQKALAFTHSKAEGKIIENGCVVEVVSASFTANVLWKLLEDWEKENEK